MSSPDLESRLARVESSLARILELLEQPSTSASAGAQQALANIYGKEEVEERFAELVLRIGEPETIEAITRIGVLLPRLEYVLQGAAGGPELIEEAMEMLRGELERHGTTPAEMKYRLGLAADALAAVSQPSSIRALKKIVQSTSGVAPVVGALGRASAAIEDAEGSGAFEARMEETLVLLLQAETLDSLGRIAALAPQIEFAVNALAAGPELMEEGMELAQERLAAEGLDQYDLKRRIEAASATAMAVSDPDTMAALAHLGRATPALKPFAEAARRTGAALVEHEGEAALTDRLAESLLRIAEPETLDALTRVACLTPQIEFAVNALAAGPELLEEAMELLQENAKQSGLDQYEMNRRVRAAVETVTQLSDPKTLAAIASMDFVSLAEVSKTVGDLTSKVDLDAATEVAQVLLEQRNRDALMKLVALAPNIAGPLAALPVQPHTLEVLKTVNEAVETSSQQERSIGFFGLVSALGDPNVQRAVGFFISVAERLGKRLGGLKQLGSGQ